MFTKSEFFIVAISEHVRIFPKFRLTKDFVFAFSRITFSCQYCIITYGSKITRDVPDTDYGGYPAGRICD
jgi:hypothetical protein